MHAVASLYFEFSRGNEMKKYLIRNESNQICCVYSKIVVK